MIQRKRQAEKDDMCLQHAMVRVLQEQEKNVEKHAKTLLIYEDV